MKAKKKYFSGITSKQAQKAANALAREMMYTPTIEKPKRAQVKMAFPKLRTGAMPMPLFNSVKKEIAKKPKKKIVRWGLLDPRSMDAVSETTHISKRKAQGDADGRAFYTEVVRITIERGV